MMDRIRDWVALNLVTGVGKVIFSRLLSHFRTPSVVLEASYRDLLGVKGVGEKIAKEIASLKGGERLERELELIKKNDVTILTLDDRRYPALLKSIYSPPPVLYMKGDIEEEDRLSVVGSRSPTYYGKAVAEKIVVDLTKNSLAIVSGMARGIDTVAHSIAIRECGRTIAVLGCGIDVVYPPENMNLMEKITHNGAVVSEYPMGTLPLKENFPVRNRIISGLSLGTLVVEASERSGALITAKHALEQGREVFAVPGNIGAKTSKGTNLLIKQGARLVENSTDILLEIEGLLSKKIEKGGEKEEAGKDVTSVALDREEEAVYSLFEDEPLHIDLIARRTEMSVSRLSFILLNLEMLGVVRQEPGKRFAKVIV